MAAKNGHAKKFYFAVIVCTLFIIGAKYVLNDVINAKYVINVPYVSQEGSVATGCELVSATMVLKYYNCNVSVEDVVGQTPTSNLTQTKSGLLGDNPSNYFIGDPHSLHGFGCYAPVIVSVMNYFLEKNGDKRAVNMTGANIDTLINNYIKKNNPVLIWATSNMKEPSKGDSWTIRGTDKTFQWIAGEHCLVLVGYDNDNYYFNDPYDSNGVISFNKDLVKKRYISLGKQAVVVRSSI